MPSTADVALSPDVSLATSIEVDRSNLVAPVLFAGLYALLSLLILPWPVGAAWFVAIVGWETCYRYVIEPCLLRRSEHAGIRVLAASNLIGASLYAGLSLAALRTGTPIGVAMGAAWLSGAFMNSVIYYGENRLLLWAALTPSIAVAVAGPALAHGPTLAGGAVSSLILTTLLAAQSFSGDHRKLIDRLGERQTALAEMEGKLAMAVEASGDGMFDVDLLSGDHDVSPGWASMLGFERAALKGVRLLTLVHPDDLPAVNEELDRHFRGETPHTTTEQRMRCADGNYKWVLTRSRVVARDSEGRPWRVVGTTVDLSRRKALELQLEAARDTAENANAAKSMFVANMSHEIRTPLNGVIAVAGVLARTELSEAQREMIGIVQSSAQVLERLLGDILDQSKLEAGEFELQVAPFDLREAVEAAAELMRARADEKGLAFDVSYSEAAAGAFEGDAVRLRQIIANLAGNAIKFTETGGVSIHIDAAPAGETDAVTLEVRDTGIGFDAEAGDRLFSRFVQADGSISRRFGGTGLGLAICKALAELMGGEINAQSTPGAGSTFTVRLPLRRVSPAAPAVAAPAASDAGIDLEGLRVLLAEDHPTNQRVIQLILAPFGVDLTVVGDGAEALELLARGTFDLVLMDMQMPVLDGLAATRAIRERERVEGAPRLPLAMLTANAMEEHRALAAAAGADWHIAKPITPESLLAGIAATFAQADAPDGESAVA